MTWLDDINWDKNGLVPTIAQDYHTGQVLTLAWMNREALELTQEEQRAIYWSRSRQTIWRKGEQSGFIQKLRELRLDCDGDTVLLKVEQVGNIACHTGRAHCFYKVLSNNNWQIDEPVLENPNTIYQKNHE